MPKIEANDLFTLKYDTDKDLSEKPCQNKYWSVKWWTAMELTIVLQPCQLEGLELLVPIWNQTCLRNTISQWLYLYTVKKKGQGKSHQGKRQRSCQKDTQLCQIWKQSFHQTLKTILFTLSDWILTPNFQEESTVFIWIDS